jgi:hypothetical protein
MFSTIWVYSLYRGVQVISSYETWFLLFKDETSSNSTFHQYEIHMYLIIKYDFQIVVLFRYEVII